MEPEMSRPARCQVLVCIQDVILSWMKISQAFVVVTPSSFSKTFQPKDTCISATGASYGFFPSTSLRTGYAECALRMTLRALHLSG